MSISKRLPPSERLQRATDRAVGKMRQVESLLRQKPMSKKQMAAEIGCCEKTIQRALRDIAGDGVVIERIASPPPLPPLWQIGKKRKQTKRPAKP